MFFFFCFSSFLLFSPVFHLLFLSSLLIFISFHLHLSHLSYTQKLFLIKENILGKSPAKLALHKPLSLPTMSFVHVCNNLGTVHLLLHPTHTPFHPTHTPTTRVKPTSPSNFTALRLCTHPSVSPLSLKHECPTKQTNKKQPTNHEKTPRIKSTPSNYNIILSFLVTTSLCQDWTVRAPPAFLRRGGRLSGSISRFEH